MLARAHTFTIDGLQTRRVTGLADASVREARERIHTAIRNSGYEFPVSGTGIN